MWVDSCELTNGNKAWTVDGKPVQIRCFLCGRFFTLFQSKKGKPYGVCTFCGYQIFFRMGEGISRLIRAARNPEVKSVQFMEVENAGTLGNRGGGTTEEGKGA